MDQKQRRSRQKMTFRQRLVLLMLGQLVLFVIVGATNYRLYHSDAVPRALSVPLVALFAFQTLMLVRSAKVAWRVF